MQLITLMPALSQYKYIKYWLEALYIKYREWIVFYEFCDNFNASGAHMGTYNIQKHQKTNTVPVALLHSSL